VFILARMRQETRLDLGAMLISGEASWVPLWNMLETSFVRIVTSYHCLSDIPLVAHDIRKSRALQNDVEDTPEEPIVVVTPTRFATPVPDDSSPPLLPISPSFLFNPLDEQSPPTALVEPLAVGISGPVESPPIGSAPIQSPGDLSTIQALAVSICDPIETSATITPASVAVGISDPVEPPPIVSAPIQSLGDPSTIQPLAVSIGDPVEPSTSIAPAPGQPLEVGVPVLLEPPAPIVPAVIQSPHSVPVCTHHVAIAPPSTERPRRPPKPTLKQKAIHADKRVAKTTAAKTAAAKMAAAKTAAAKTAAAQKMVHAGKKAGRKTVAKGNPSKARGESARPEPWDLHLNADAPVYLVTAVNHLKEGKDLGSQWRRVVEAWLILEVSMAYGINKPRVSFNGILSYRSVLTCYLVGSNSCHKQTGGTRKLDRKQKSLLEMSCHR
jgi:hypothetical protein